MRTAADIGRRRTRPPPLVLCTGIFRDGGTGWAGGSRRRGLDTPAGSLDSAAVWSGRGAYNSGFDYVKYRVFYIVGIISAPVPYRPPPQTPIRDDTNNVLGAECERRSDVGRRRSRPRRWCRVPEHSETVLPGGRVGRDGGGSIPPPARSKGGWVGRKCD